MSTWAAVGTWLSHLRLMLPKAAAYYEEMTRRERVVYIVDDDGGLVAVCTFFLLEREADADRYHARSMWSTPDDAEDGIWCYVDKLWCRDRSWGKDLCLSLEFAIRYRYPQIRWAVWYRPTKDIDRRYTRRVKEGFDALVSG